MAVARPIDHSLAAIQDGTQLDAWGFKTLLVNAFLLDAMNYECARLWLSSGFLFTCLRSNQPRAWPVGL